ncbi:MAG TPA: trimethylamine methyltransferase family protein [Acidimicrobiia bacterium]|jgi:trimethylamine--corrinoid protein Co-methyltransferase|nr:trimethylamine methyltransferase family protein [Acidimicrobiia bacterium]
MSEPGTRRRSGGREARRAVRSAATAALPYLTRSIPPYEILGEEGLATIEANAETILEEVGVEIVDFPEALRIYEMAGADVSGTRVRFPKGMCRELAATAPSRFTQVARNPERSVEIGDPHVVLAPAYGSPFVRDLEGGRRYATIEDFRNFARLTYMSPQLHHAGGTLCEPVDLPVNKRHFDMIYSHVKYSDKPFMGSVTAPERAQDTVDMAKIVFGEDFIAENTVILSLCNANSPLSWDRNMLGSARVYAENNQATLLTPFILAGAMAPVTVAGTAAQTLAEALAGIAFTQIVRPGAPVVFGSFASSMSMQSGAPTFGTPEPALVLFVMAALARRLGVPFRSGGNLTASKIPDAQSAYESAATFLPTLTAGVNFVLHTAGWLEGGLTMGYEKFILDADMAGMASALVSGVDLTENGQAMESLLTTGPGQHYLGTAHTLANFETAFWRADTSDSNSFEQWELEGGRDAVARASERWRQMLSDYEAPSLDDDVDHRLSTWIQQRKDSFPDSDV